MHTGYGLLSRYRSSGAIPLGPVVPMALPSLSRPPPDFTSADPHGAYFELGTELRATSGAGFVGALQRRLGAPVTGTWDGPTQDALARSPFVRALVSPGVLSLIQADQVNEVIGDGSFGAAVLIVAGTVPGAPYADLPRVDPATLLPQWGIAPGGAASDPVVRLDAATGERLGVLSLSVLPRAADYVDPVTGQTGGGSAPIGVTPPAVADYVDPVYGRVCYDGRGNPYTGPDPDGLVRICYLASDRVDAPAPLDPAPVVIPAPRPGLSTAEKWLIAIALAGLAVSVFRKPSRR